MSENVSFRSALHGFNRADVLNYIKNLIDEKASLTAALEAAQAELAAAKAQVQEMQLQLQNSDAEKQNEQTLGRAMCDARRMSDLIVQEAKQQADAMYADAADAAGFASEKASEIAVETDAFKAYFNDTVQDVDARLALLQESLKKFSEEMETKQKQAQDSYEQASGEPKETPPANRLTVRKVKR